VNFVKTKKNFTRITVFTQEGNEEKNGDELLFLVCLILYENLLKLGIKSNIKPPNIGLGFRLINIIFAFPRIQCEVTVYFHAE